MDVVYANRIETLMRSRKSTAKSATRRHLLMGTWLRVLAQDGEWLEVVDRTGAHAGFVLAADVALRAPLKIFYVDVGQGDGAIIESPQGILLIDGGPSKDYYRTLKARAQPVIDDTGEPVHITAIVMSHPDDDHFVGLTHLLKDPDFTVGRIYHNGVIRFHDDSDHGAMKLGTTANRLLNGETHEVLSQSYNTMGDVEALLAEGDLKARFKAFWEAAKLAQDEGRLLNGARRLTHRSGALSEFDVDPADGLHIDVLGPVATKDSGSIEFVTFPSPEHPDAGASASHTINGHSVVLKLTFGEHTFMFGGDLNIPAQRYLLEHYAAQPELFEVDVNKACHHGSSDFLVDFLKKANPRATVFSSGEDRLHDHPLPDAMGAAIRHSRGDIPLLFSTELARTPLGGGKLLRGDINARSNGTDLVLAQRKERGSKDVWHSFDVPFAGRFQEATD